jgi:Pyridoxamine 5'-phosphate oxidase
MEIIYLGAADGLPPVDWATVVENLDSGSAPAPEAHNARTKWLVTVNKDGSPHVTAVGAIWLDGTFWFQTGRNEEVPQSRTRPPLLGRHLDSRRGRCHRGHRNEGNGPGDP